MSFSTAELFQSSANESITHNGKSQTRKGHSVKAQKNKRYQQHAHQHVPNNSKIESYRFYDDIADGNDNPIFEHDHINIADFQLPQQNNSHKHNVSLVSLASNNWHGRSGTIGQYMLDTSLEVIDGDIPSQKEIMKDFFQERVAQAQHLHNQSYVSNNGDENDTNHNPMFDSNFTGTMREIKHPQTPLDESEIINFNDIQDMQDIHDIDIPDYTDDEEDNVIDPMQLIATKGRLKSSFPDTYTEKRKRRRHNTEKSPIPHESALMGPMTPSGQSVVINSDSDNDTYDDNSSNDDSEPRPISHRGSQRVLDTEPHTHKHKHQLRSNTITNIGKMVQNKELHKRDTHRHSRSEVPSMKKTDLFNLYKGGNSAKNYFSHALGAVKSNQFETEKKVRQEMEKKYKPKLEQTQIELDQARRRSLEQSKEMENMKRELQSIKHSHESHANEKGINKKLREKNLQIQELQSKLKFEYLKNSSVNITPIIANIPNIPNMTHPNRRHSAIRHITGVEQGLVRLKKRVSKSSKRKSLPKSKSQKQGQSKGTKPRPLWTNRPLYTLTKSKTFDKDDIKKKETAEYHANYKKLGIKNRLIKKRESLLLPYPQTGLKSRFFDRNKVKRGSYHAGLTTDDKVDYDKLKHILVAASKHNCNSKTHNANREEIKDVKARYEHLLAENEILRKENLNAKNELKQYSQTEEKAPIPNGNGKTDNSILVSPPIFKIERSMKKKKKDFSRKKRLLQVPKHRMIGIDWTPIENSVVKETRWKYISNDGGNIMIPNEFEQLFRLGEGPKKEEKKDEIVSEKLKKMKLSPKDIRHALLNVDESKLSLDILYNLLEIVPNLNEQKAVQSKMNQIQENAFSEQTYLTFVEQFFYELSDINHLKLRVELILFKYRFNNIINERYNELFVLLESLKSIQRSSHFERILSIILTFGNFMNARANNPFGISGFKLESLLELHKVRSSYASRHSFLSFICKFCMEHSDAKYRKYLDIISELDLCHKACLIKSYECHQKILLITEELSKFGRSLRKFRKKAIPTTDNDSDGKAYKPIENDFFEMTMRDFARKAHLVCKALLDTRHEIITIAQILSTQYNYNLNNDKIEDLLHIFSKFITDLKYGKNLYINNCRKEKMAAVRSIMIDRKKEKLNRFLEKRNKDRPKYARVYDQDSIDLKEREKDENIQRLSKLIYEHAILMDQHNINGPQMSYQRIKYLKGLAKSNELPNQLSNNPEAIQKERRRRRSLTNTDIQIGNNMAMTLAEDEEMK